jgi:hypothetical protein
MVRCMTVRIGSYTAVERPDGGHRAAPSSVWRGEDEAGSPVCLLLVPIGDAGGIPRVVAAAAAVNHRHLLPVIDVVTDAERAAVVADWPRGGRLLELVRRRGPLPADVTLTVLLLLASALAAIHRSGSRHGGVGAGSVFFDDGGRPLLGALAISTIVSDRNGGLPRESWDVAPELVRGERLARAPMTPAADIFSLGSVALYCLTGAPAWPADDPADVLIQSAAGVWPEPPPDAGPRALVELIRRMLLDDPAARPSAEELVGLLAAIGPPSPVPVTTRRGRATATGARWAGRSAESVDARGVPPDVQPRAQSGSDAAVPGGRSRDGEAGTAVADPAAAATDGTPITRSVVHVQTPDSAVRDQGAASPAPVRHAAGAQSRRTPPIQGRGSNHSGSNTLRGTVRARRFGKWAEPSGAAPRGWPGRRPPAVSPLAASALTGTRAAQLGSPPARAADRRAGGTVPGRTPFARAAIAVLSAVLAIVVALQVWVWSTGVEDSAARADAATLADPNTSPAPTGAVPVCDQDWLAVVRTLDAARGSAVAAADAELLDRVYVTGSAAAAADADTIHSLTQRGWRVSGGRHVIDDVTVIGPAPAQSAGAAYVSSGSPSADPPTQRVTASSATAPSLGAPTTGNGTAPAAEQTASAAPAAVRVAVRGSLPAYQVLDTEGRHVADTAARPAAEWILTITETDKGYRISAVEQG